MSDLISRQAVFNTLENVDKFLDEERTVEKYKELLTECIGELPSAENKGEWIPVSERLPENSDYVLATDGVDMFVAWHNPEKERFKGWHSSDEKFDLKYSILAWQPLPEPYKGVSE